MVRRIYRMYIDDGLSHQKIARRLNDDGVSTKTTRVAARSHDGIKKGWMGSQIGKMLIDQQYKGQTYYNRTRKSGGRHPAEEWIPVEVASVVTEEEWEAVRLRAKRNFRESQRPQDKRSEFLLSGRIRCQECGQTMTASTKRHRANGKAYSYRRYVCVGQKQYKTKCRTPLEPSAELIEGNVLGLLADTFSDPVNSVWKPEPSSMIEDTLPWTFSVPSLGVMMPASALSKVDFPAPFCPSTPTVVPFLIDRLMPSSAVNSR